MNIDNIIKNGTRLDGNWYHFKGVYYKIADGEILEKSDNFVDLDVIIGYGDTLPYDWYGYYGKYYRIIQRQLIAVTSNLEIDEDIKSFKYTTPDGMSTVLVIGQYVGVLVNNSLSSVQAFRDYYYISDTPEGIKRQLRRGSITIFVADDIYRLDNGQFVGVSNGVHYLMNIHDDKVDKKPVSKYRLRSTPDGKIEEYFNNTEWKILK